MLKIFSCQTNQWNFIRTMAGLNSCFDLFTRMISRLNLLIQEGHEGTWFAFLVTSQKWLSPKLNRENLGKFVSLARPQRIWSLLKYIMPIKWTTISVLCPHTWNALLFKSQWFPLANSIKVKINPWSLAEVMEHRGIQCLKWVFF